MSSSIPAPTSASMPKFAVTWRVNGEVTYILENITAEMAWEESVPDEAFIAAPYNRWHVFMRMPSLARMKALAIGETFVLAYQDPSAVGADTEKITVERIF